MPVLDRGDATGGEAPPVTQALDLIDDRNRRVARPEKIGVQRVDDEAALHRSPGGDQRLSRDLAAEDAHPVLLRRAAPEEVQLELLEIEDRDQLVESRLAAGIAHGGRAYRRLRGRAISGAVRRAAVANLRTAP